MRLFVDILCWPLVVVGIVFIVASGVGMVRLPDLYTRLHAASLADTGGTMLIGLAMLLQSVFVFGSPVVAIKVVLVVFFMLLTAPTASHALAKMALLSGLVPVDKDGRPLLDSSEQASRLARSRAEDFEDDLPVDGDPPDDGDGRGDGDDHGDGRDAAGRPGDATGGA